MIKGQPGQQLRLFVDPEEHIRTVADSVDLFDDESMDDLWSKKEQESKRRRGSGHGSGIYDSIAKHGVTSHVAVYPQYGGAWKQGEGHHRVAAAAALQRETGKSQFVPIHYVDPTVPYQTYRPQQLHTGFNR